MHLYSLTLQRPTAINCAVHGNFTGTKQQEIVVGRTKTLELLQVNENGKVQVVLSVEIFGIVRSLTAFRLTGGKKDYIVVGTDSGRITILEYNSSKNAFDRVQMETFGKTGSRRIIPGQYLASDPKGRAIMIGAVEKQKLVYIPNRDSAARLTISSPLEAHKSHSILFSIAGLDVGFENPLFACIELDYEDADSDSTGVAASAAMPSLTFYELDLGLNHVVRQSSEFLPAHANMLIPVFGGETGPGGVLVCCEGFIMYKTPDDLTMDIRCPFPGRKHDISSPEKRGPGHGIVVAYTTLKPRGKKGAEAQNSANDVYLVQLDSGDLFRVTLFENNRVVTGIGMRLLDTLPVASSLHLLRSGFLFLAAEFGNHYMYHVESIDDENEPQFTSAGVLLPDESLAAGGEEGTGTVTRIGVTDSGDLDLSKYKYSCHTLRNHSLVDSVDSIAPIIQMRADDLTNEDSPQLYTLAGRGPRSSLRVLRHGLHVSILAMTTLPATPTGLWSVRKSIHDKFDKYIVVTWVNATVVLSVGTNVTPVTDSGFTNSQPTLLASRLGDDFLQVTPEGFRHIKSEKRITDWRAPVGKEVKRVAANDKQVVLALKNGDVLAFELGSANQLIESNERLSLTSEVCSLAVAPVPADRQRARFLAIGCADNTVRLVSLEVNDTLQPLSMQALPAKPESLCFVEIASDNSLQSTDLVLCIGLDNGVLLRTTVDVISGGLQDTRTRYLGNRPVKLQSLTVRGAPAILALSTRPWIFYSYNGSSLLTPLSYEALDSASSFASEVCSEGIISLVGDSLRIFPIPRLGETYHQISLPLKYTPRRMVVHPLTGYLIIIESDHNMFSSTQRLVERAKVIEQSDDMVTQEEEELGDDVTGAPAAGEGRYAACIRVVDPIQCTSIDVVDLDDDESAFSLAIVNFHGHDMPHVIVGTAKKLDLKTRICENGSLRTYQLNTSTMKLELLHKTDVEDIPGAIHAFQGRALVGVGHLLRIYDIGKRKLLRKSETRQLPNFVAGINVSSGRIVVNDIQQSFHFLKYRPAENQLIIFADDSSPRWITQGCLLDHDTVASGDKFGNFSVLRLPSDVADDIDADPTGGKLVSEKTFLNGAPQKADAIINFNIGDTITSLQRAVLVPAGPECLVYSTIQGAIGTMLPFSSQDDIEFFQTLETQLRQENAPLCGRDHLAFRSYYFPCKNVIDGDLCEQFNTLDYAKRRQIAEEMNRTPSEISKKLEIMRTRYAY